MVDIGSRRPRRAVQRARLWAMTCAASQAALAGKRPEGRWFSPTPYLRSDGVLDLGMAAMVSVQFQGVAVSIGDESVIAVGGEQGQLRTGRGFHPPYNEPYGCGVGLILERNVRGFGHVGSALHPVGDGGPLRLEYGLDDTAQALVLSGGDGEANLRLAADGDDVVGVEAAVSPHGELTRGTGVAHAAHRLPQEVGGAPRRVGPSLAQPTHQHLSGDGGHGQQRVIAPLASVVVALGAFLGQAVSLADGGV